MLFLVDMLEFVLAVLFIRCRSKYSFVQGEILKKEAHAQSYFYLPSREKT